MGEVWGTKQWKTPEGRTVYGERRPMMVEVTLSDGSVWHNMLGVADGVTARAVTVDGERFTRARVRDWDDLED